MWVEGRRLVSLLRNSFTQCRKKDEMFGGMFAGCGCIGGMALVFVESSGVVAESYSMVGILGCTNDDPLGVGGYM